MTLKALIDAGWFAPSADHACIALRLSGVAMDAPAREGLSGVNRLMEDLSDEAGMPIFEDSQDGAKITLPKAHVFDDSHRETLIMRAPTVRDLIECGLGGGIADIKLCCYLMGVTYEDFITLPACTARPIIDRLSPFLE